jgi:hypothetical protein
MFRNTIIVLIYNRHRLLELTFSLRLRKILSFMNSPSRFIIAAIKYILTENQGEKRVDIIGC